MRTHIDQINVSERETEILVLMSDGLTSKEIGRRLYLSNLTVDKHKSNLLNKFNARNAPHLIVQALRMGFISFEPEYSLEFMSN